MKNIQNFIAEAKFLFNYPICCPMQDINDSFFITTPFTRVTINEVRADKHTIEYAD